MKRTTEDMIRTKYLNLILDVLKADEDVGIITSNSLNFPIAVDGEEGWVEIVVKIPRHDEGYEKREEYSMVLKEREARAARHSSKAT